MATSGPPAPPPGISVNPLANMVEVGVSDPVWVASMNGNIAGLQNVLQQGNLGPGVNEVIEQTIMLTKHGVASFVKMGNMESIIASRPQELKDARDAMKSEVSAKIRDIENKELNMQNMVSDAVGGI